jgi:hypothetical protein
MWKPFQNGATVTQSGSENGTILYDEDLPEGARITLEEGGSTPFSITCGIYGLMAHTVFASSKKEALDKYKSMKQDIESFMLRKTSERENSDWCSWFAHKY